MIIETHLATIHSILSDKYPTPKVSTVLDEIGIILYKGTMDINCLPRLNQFFEKITCNLTCTSAF